MKSIFFILIITLAALSTPLQAQSELAPVDSLNQSLFKKSNKYVESGTVYRVVKWNVLSAYFEDVKALDDEKSSQIVSSAQDIEALEAKQKSRLLAYDELNAKYEYAVKVNDAMEFFSLLIPKARYNIIMWSLVCLLIVGILVLYLMYNRVQQITRHAKKELDEKLEEFEAYRKRALKREQEVASGYLRDIKKLKEKLGGF